jgi:hypothetical protein
MLALQLLLFSLITLCFARFGEETLPPYWVGPYGIRVKRTIESVPDLDGCNYMYDDNTVTTMGCMKCDDPEIGCQPLEKISKEDYLSRYAEERNGNYYYVEKKE